MRPSALQLDVIADLVDHLLELSRVHSIGAHGNFSLLGTV
jgi:hypothetical protein